MEKVLVTIAVPAAQLDAANVAMVQATGNGADGRTFVALEWALLEEAGEEEKTGFALTSNLFEPDVADTLLGWQSPIMVRADMPVFEAVADMGLGPWVDPDAPAPQLIDRDAIALAKEREGMVASPAQIRLTLYQLSLLDTVQYIADTDPMAAIVWEYAAEIRRTNALIDALGSDGFEPKQIDDIFRYAMQLQI